MEMLTRDFKANPHNSYNPATRRFEAVMMTDTPVRRRGYYEVLDPSTVDVEKLVRDRTPILNNHKQDDLKHIIGAIVEARHEGNSIVVVGELCDTDDVASIRTKVERGNIRGVSIGYQAKKIREETRDSGERFVYFQPEIYEMSLVVNPADKAAHVRNKETSPMPTENNESRQTADNDNVREFRSQVRTIARGAGLPTEWADDQIDSGADLVAVRAAAFDAIQSRTAPTIRTNAPANDDPNVILERRADALFARVNGTAPDDAARQYFNDGLADHARAIVTMRGISTTGMDREQILRSAMHTTGDFPNLLTGVGNRTLMPAYQAAQSPLKLLARQALMSDFRTGTRLKLGEIGTLKEVTESGEIKSTSRSEATESYALKTFGETYALSRKALVNDDLGAFRDWSVAAGRAAATTESDALFNLLTQSSGAGPLMGEDGKRLFHADHGNLASVAGAVSAGDALSLGRLALRRMKGLDGKTPIAVSPKFLLVGPDQETVAEKALAEISATTVDDVNPFAGKLTLLVEPRINGNAWYLFADPAQLAVLEYAYLSSAQGPQIASREGWDVLGMEFRVTLDFGCGGVDWRGAYRNAGA